MENFYKVFKDEVFDEDQPEEDRESEVMKGLLGDEDELEEMLMAASAEVFRYLASHPAPLQPAERALDDDDSEATEVLGYKFVDHESFVEEFSDADDLTIQ